MSLDVRLRNILNRLKDGGYVDKFDALSLSRIEVPGVPATVLDGSGISADEPKKLPGLKMLEDDVLSILTAERIREQGAIMFSKAELSRCEEEIAELTVGVFKRLRDLDATSDMTSVDIEGISTDLSLPKLRRRLQECYDTATAVLSAKAYAFDRVNEVCALYTSLLSAEAQACGIRYSAERSRLVVTPRQKELLSHQFFDTSEV
jgi:hypothetical protein